MAFMNIKRAIFIAGIIFFVIVCFAFDAFYAPPVGATGGAFPNTKHGGSSGVDGGAWCPSPPCGVNRALDPDVGTYYYENAEAGRYQPGECAHCHEPHTSFSGVEPPPNLGSDAGPDVYLLMKEYGTPTIYAELCWYCHENMSLGDPPKLPGYGYFGFYQGRAEFETSSHYQSPVFIYPGAHSVDTSAPASENPPWPRRSRNALPTGNINSCLNCHSPHGVAGNAYYAGDALAPLITNYGVAASSVTNNAVIPRQLIAWEEALCLRCHDRSASEDAGGNPSPGPANTNVKDEVDKYLNDAGSGHPVRRASYLGRHSLAGIDDDASTLTNNEIGDNVTAGWFTSATSHAECVDCHNPHRVQGTGTGMTTATVFQPSQGTNNPEPAAWNPNRYDGGSTNSSSSQVRLGAVNVGVWGVSVSSTATGQTSATPISDLTTDDRVYNLCFKCHSAWAWSSARTIGTLSDIIPPSSSGDLKTDDGTKVTAWGTGVTGAIIPLNYLLTDVAAEFRTNNLSYHPVFAVGRNRPELGNDGTANNADDVRNPNWCGQAGSTYTVGDANCRSAAGVREDLINITESVNSVNISMEQTLSQAFVPPWRHTSIITCVDCHEDSSDTTPRGPHGSSRPFILRTVDGAISYDVCTSASAAENSVCNGVTTISYSNLDTANNGNIFCWNCHRADIYNITGGWVTAPTIRNLFARQPHPMHGSNDAGLINESVTTPTRGVACMGCHGGGAGLANPTPANCGASNCKLGNIHGNSYDTAGDGKDNRLIAPGGYWDSWIRVNSGSTISCVPGGQGDATTYGWGGCTTHNGSAGETGGSTAQYTYSSP